MELAALEIVYDEPEKDYELLRLEVCCNTPGSKTRENVLSAVKRGLPVITLSPPHDTPAVLVGGGPSLKKNWQEVGLWQKSGAHIFALNGAAKFLTDHGIKPHYQVMLDPRPQNVALIGDAQAYLFASQCAPEVFDALPADRTAIFHCMGSSLPSDETPVVKDGTVKGIVAGYLVGGNHTVGLASMCLVNLMGYKSLHLYGYDSSYDGDQEHHAYPQSQTDQEFRTLAVTIQTKDGYKEFLTNMTMAKQAELFIDTARILIEDGAEINVHGEGLIPALARTAIKES